MNTAASVELSRTKVEKIRTREISRRNVRARTVARHVLERKTAKERRIDGSSGISRARTCGTRSHATTSQLVLLSPVYVSIYLCYPPLRWALRTLGHARFLSHSLSLSKFYLIPLLGTKDPRENVPSTLASSAISLLHKDPSTPWFPVSRYNTLVSRSALRARRPGEARKRKTKRRKRITHYIYIYNICAVYVHTYMYICIKVCAQRSSRDRFGEE